MTWLHLKMPFCRCVFLVPFMNFLRVSELEEGKESYAFPMEMVLGWEESLYTNLALTDASHFWDLVTWTILHWTQFSSRFSTNHQSKQPPTHLLNEPTNQSTIHPPTQQIIQTNPYPPKEPTNQPFSLPNSSYINEISWHLYMPSQLQKITSIRESLVKDREHRVWLSFTEYSHKVDQKL